MDAGSNGRWNLGEQSDSAGNTFPTNWSSGLANSRPWPFQPPLFQQPPPPFSLPFLHPPQPSVFDDDEEVEYQPEFPENISAVGDHAIEIKTYPELNAVAKLSSYKNFTILIHLKGLTLPSTNQNSRAPVDLVAVLDVSGSMAGVKLALLKQAMGFVIQNLGPSDRLSVVSFSDRARRVFPLHRMTEYGKQSALQAVGGLVSGGGTHIADGLGMGAKVMTDRRWRNPVGSIIFLSDGCDTYTVMRSSRGGNHDYQTLVPQSIRRDSGSGNSVPIHTFGFGSDHNPALMHSIAEACGGTFSFIESGSAIQDAFALCIGGILSVVVQELQVKAECVHPNLRLCSIKAGSYKAYIPLDKRMGFIEVGDLYAEEERDFLIEVDIPPVEFDGPCSDMSLVKVSYAYKDPITKKLMTKEGAGQAVIQRPDSVTQEMVVLVEVDRQRNRVQAAEAIVKARAAAEQGDLASAKATLHNCCQAMSETTSAQSGDQLYAALSAELREIEEKMANMSVYVKHGRALALSGLSSHMRQRAATHGSVAMFGSCSPQCYQTPSMSRMVQQSQSSSGGLPPPFPASQDAPPPVLPQ